MKSLIAILSIFVISATLSAQSTSPRWGSGPPRNDNTGRVLTYIYGNVTTTASQAVAYQKPNAYQTIYRIGTLTHALLDSMSIRTAYVGDRVTMVFTADTLTAGRVVTFGNNIKYVTSTLTVPKSKKASISFIFDGAAWIETNRTLMGN